MSLELARAYVQIVPSMQGVQSSINKTFASAGDTAGKTVGSRTSGGILKGVAAAGAGILGAIGIAKVGNAIGKGVGETVSRGLTRAIDIQNAQKKLSGLGHSAEGVTKIMGNALDAVRGTAFGLGDAATVAASAVAAGIKPGKELTGYLKLTADTATIAGTSLSDMGSILNKATASGKVYTDTLNQLSDRGVPVFQYLQKEYHTTAAGLTDMVKKGQVDAATLDKVLAQHLGGSALKSGETAQGAFANVGAAFGRLGVQFGAGTAVDRAPKLFTAIAGAVDSTGAATKPLSDILNHQLALGFKSLTGYVNGIDFTKVGAQVKIIAGNVKAFLGGLQKPSSTPAGIPVSGFAAAGAKVRGILASTVGVVHDAIAKIQAIFAQLKSGNVTGAGASLGTSLGAIFKIASQSGPILQAFAQGFGSLASGIAGVIAQGLPVLVPLLKLAADALGFLGQHMDVIVPLIPIIVAGFLLWRTATTSVLAANRLLTAVELAALPVRVTSNAVRLAAASAELRLAAAQGIVIPSLVGIALATARQTIATVANTVASAAARVGMLAGAAATGVMAAAQRLLNAAVTANPIGLLVVAIAAVVGALVYWITQTKAGQAFFKGFLGFLSNAWGTVVNVWNAAFRVISSAVQIVFRAIVAYVTTYINVARTVITGVLAAIGVVFRTYTALWAAIIHAVFATIHAVVTAGVNTVKTVIGAALAVIVAIFTGHWDQIPGIIGGAVGKVLGIARGLGSTLVGILKKLGTEILGAFGNAGALLLKIGSQIVDGLISGIKGGISGAVSAISGLINLLPLAARKLLGIASPSKVFTQIGRFVAQGLVKGLNGTQDQVKTAVTSLVNKVTDAFSKLADQREAAQKKLLKLDKQLAATDTSTKSGSTSAAKLKASIAEQNSIIAAVNAAPKGASKKTLLSVLKADTASLTSLAGRRDKLAGQLKTAQDKLAAAVSTRNDFRNAVQQSSIGLGDVVASFKTVADARTAAATAVTDLQGQLDTLRGSAVDQTDATAVADQAKQIASLETQIATQAKTAAQASAPTILDTLKTAILQTNAFRTTLASLKAQGLDDTTYSQLVSAGVAGGGLQAAQELAAAGTGVVQQVVALQGQLSTAGAALGTSTSTVLYQAGVDAAQGSVDGIKAKIVDNQAAIALLQAAMAASISTLGINTSALTRNVGAQIAAGLTDGIKGKSSDLAQVMVQLGITASAAATAAGNTTSRATQSAGAQVVDGFATGIKGGQPALNKAIDHLGLKTIKRLKAVLGIKSPSRVARLQVGQQFGRGYVLGIEDMHADAERAAAGLAAIPGAAMTAAGFGDLGAAPAPITQIFQGQMGYTRDEVAEEIATKARRAIAGVNIPTVRVA